MADDRYYFHLTDGNQTIVDREGVALATVFAARERALRQGRQIVQNLQAVVEVTNSNGRLIMMAPLSVNEAQLPSEPALDALTNLPLRTAFLERLTLAMRSVNPPSRVGLLVLDLDRLKDTNDALGHPAGDAVLKGVADTLIRQAFEHAYVVARLEGDKFALILLDVGTQRKAIAIAERIQSALAEPLQYGDVRIRHTVSGGLALFPDHGEGCAELMGNADLALHIAKSSGGGSLVAYAHGMRADQDQKIAALSEARSAVAEARIVPYYQPKLLLRTMGVCGFEALLRTKHPSLGIRPPADIADALDHPELSVAIGREMQARVFDDVQGWMAKGVEFGKVAINASPVELLLSQYARDLLERLAARKIPPNQIQLEVTETGMTGQGSSKIISELQRLRDHGIAVFLDDFGTGYGSMVHLREFPVNGIKIDRSFISGVGQDAHGRAIASALIQLAQSLDLLLVAEGVETQGQADFLMAQNCEVVQGYLYSEAMPADSVPDFVRARHRAPVRG